MPRFLLLAYEAEDLFADISPEGAQAIIQRYIDWSTRLREGGHLIHSDKLRDGEGRALHREQGRLIVRDGPYAETKEVIGGFWLIQAADYDAAIALAQDCPHVDLAQLVIRQVDEL
jgi:hypothetical protein